MYLNIKLLVIDVDGTLTDGTLLFGDNSTEIKSFSVKDGAVIKPLNSLGITVIFLTGRKSEAVEQRAKELNVVAIQGVVNKLTTLNSLLTKYNISPEQCAYIGDDLNDYAAMNICGFKACPADAVIEIRKISDYVSHYNGGQGAVREICDFILKRDEKYEDFLSYYGIITTN